MGKYIIQRMIQWPIVILAVILTVFVLSLYGPGDPAQLLLGQRMDPESLERIRHQLGLDQPFLVQFGQYIWNALHLDFGESYKQVGMPISELILPRLWVSFQLSSMGLLIALFLGIPLGVLAAYHQGTWKDKLLIAFALLGISFPVFVTAPLLIWLLSTKFHLVPALWHGIWSQSVIIPLLVVGVFSIAGLIRYTRNSVLQELFQDYVRTARAKGLPERMILTSHVLKNAMIPLVAVIALSLPGLLTGSFMVELIFGIPGVGRLFLEAAFSRDYPTLLASTLMVAIAYNLANLLRDLAYTYLDPRISLGGDQSHSSPWEIFAGRAYKKILIIFGLGVLAFYFALRIFGLEWLLTMLLGLLILLIVVLILGFFWMLLKTAKVYFSSGVLKRFLANRVAVASLIVVAVIMLLSIIIPLVSPYSYAEQNPEIARQGPTWQHWLGTDGLGRDMLTRIFYGTRTSFVVAFVVAAIVMILGIGLGTAAGYFGGWIDILIMRFCDYLFAFPGFLFLVLVAATVKPRITALAQQIGMGTGVVDYLAVLAALSFIGWASLAVLVRGQVLRLKQEQFIEAARVQGASEWRVILVHLIPNLMWLVVVLLSMDIPSIMMAESYLSFIGIGIQPPNPSLGSMVYSGYSDWRYSPHLIFFPGLFLALLIYAFSFLGDGLNDAENPRTK